MLTGQVQSLQQARSAFFIRVNGVTKCYLSRGATVRAVEAATLEIGRGEFVSIVGPSGCGKTTLLSMIGGLVEPSAGSIQFDNGSHDEPVRLGMVFQEAVLLPWRTVLSNVMLPLEISAESRLQAERRARDLLRTVGLQGFEDALPAQLSGGMQQRASIARALISDPTLLLMDEPFAALDAMTREEMASELQRVWSACRATVIFVTHSIAEAVFLSDRVVVMTRRPAKIQEIVSVHLPRPRTVEMSLSPAFVEYVARLKSTLISGGGLG